MHVCPAFLLVCPAPTPEQAAIQGELKEVTQVGEKQQQKCFFLHMAGSTIKQQMLLPIQAGIYGKPPEFRPQE
jgi:hypothetical protein